jgi:hypothetical protein
MFDVEVLIEPLDIVVVLHTPLTHVVVVQVPLEHTVRCVVLCVRALADVNISTIVRLNTTVSSTPVASNNLVVFIEPFFVVHIYISQL